MERNLVVCNTVVVDAPVPMVWRALTDPAVTKHYMFGCEVVCSWKPGSTLSWKGAADGKTYVTGKLKSISTGKSLEYTTFDPNGPYKDVPANHLTVRVKLSRKWGKTKVSFQQGNFAAVQDGRKRYEETVQGWGMVSKGFKAAAEALAK